MNPSISHIPFKCNLLLTLSPKHTVCQWQTQAIQQTSSPSSTEESVPVSVQNRSTRRLLARAVVYFVLTLQSRSQTSCTNVLNCPQTIYNIQSPTGDVWKAAALRNAPSLFTRLIK